MLTSVTGRYHLQRDVEANARKHGVSDEDMTIRFEHYWRAFETDDLSATMFIRSSHKAVVTDDEGSAVGHEMLA